MRRKVVKELRSLHAVAIENMTSSGVPDINYTDGWIELKHLSKFPKRPSTPVRIPHFTDVQRLWLTTREKRGGKTWLLLQCGREWFLFTGTVAAEYVGNVTRAELQGLSTWHSKTGLHKEEIIACLSQTLNPTNDCTYTD